MFNKNHISAIPFTGFSSGLGGAISGSEKAPTQIKKALNLNNTQFVVPTRDEVNNLNVISRANIELAMLAYNYAKDKEFFVNLGGDHSCAAGTWSGVAEGYRQDGDIGLLWIDAHMDSHTPASSETGNIHGMPLAALLGYGDPRLTRILSNNPKLKPENLVLIGIRSFEKGEQNLLDQLGVRVYYMEEVKERGLDAVIIEAMNIVTRNTCGYGISFDLDSIDPSVVKAVGTAVPNGLDYDEFISCFPLLHSQPPIAFEIVEYNPDLDDQQKTLTIIEQVLHEVYTLMELSKFESTAVCSV